ncbi:MAG TPA: hypothetical protein VHD55_02500 [Candidatus Paceibacterota bacterium]|nr:hypothetical protein [Candidatus Paceibacterota bacterium]
MKPNVSLPTWIQDLMVTWVRPQVTLRKVVRWSKYRKRGTRRQDTLQHTLSLLLFATWAFPLFRPHVRFDESLLFRTLLLHDFGEGETQKGDTLYIDKTRGGDLAETAAFMERFGIVIGQEGTKAFLLQFAKNANQMGEFRSILQGIKKKYPVECLLFDALERFDYFLYALEQYRELGKAKILVQVLRHQIPHFERLSRELPGFKQVLWRPDLAGWCSLFLSRYDGQWIEQKGEK